MYPLLEISIPSNYGNISILGICPKMPDPLGWVKRWRHNDGWGELEAWECYLDETRVP